MGLAAGRLAKELQSWWSHEIFVHTNSIADPGLKPI